MKQRIFKILRVLKVYMPDWSVALFRKYLEKRLYRKMLKKHKTVRPYEKGKYEMGINLIGNIRSETGLGESMRILARVLKENEIPFVILNVDSWANEDNNIHDWDDYIVEKPKYAINVIHINAGEWVRYYSDFSNEILDYRYNVAYWLWELETFPKIWRPCIDTVDAVWAPSQFICDCIKKYTKKPVVHVPYAMWLKEPVSYGRDAFDLPEDVFLYLLMYDFRSVSERKNPKASISAFKKAFSSEEANEKKVGLIIKVNNAATESEVAGLKKQLEGYKYIYFITKNLSREMVESLEAAADVLISLHRAEGFGLPMAEAMFLGTPTVVTNWSANSEFITEDSACLVDGEFIKLSSQIGPYEKGNRWMDANVDQASEYVRRLYDDKEYYESIKNNGASYVRERLSYERAGNSIKTQMEKIG
ncbi:MAG: glycosyltransferase [Lachnospiraceae bacterium]|nr:glycosyltransferase [Lachnospiraceae bacterium]